MLISATITPMNYGFWKNLPKPFFALAPMYDVTDAAFRFIIAKYGKPDLFYTEFTSTDGLISAGQEKLLHHLKFDNSEHPIVAQVFGTKPEKFAATSKLAKELGFDGIDINMGCPDKNIIKGGSCAALFKTPELARELIEASKEGGIPVSIKIRIGDTKVDWENWIAELLKAQPAAIAVHLRTRKEMSKVPAHWELMTDIVKFITEQTSPETKPIIIGNGDVMTLEEAKQKTAETGCDGIMLGRAIFGNPWLFNQTLTSPPTLEEKLKVLLEHAKLYEELFTDVKPFEIMKRHFKAYVAGWDGAAELRAQLYEAKNYHDLETVVKNFLALPRL